MELPSFLASFQGLIGSLRLALLSLAVTIPGAPAVIPGRVAAQPATPPGSAFATPVTLDSLDPAAFAEWVDGVETPVRLPDGPRHVLWTRTTPPEWNGVPFGASRQPGARHLRLGFQGPVPVGSVLVRAGGRLSVLRPSAAYPGNLEDDRQWLPAERLEGGQVSQVEVGREEYALWVLPPGTTTRALRFTHVAAPTDADFAGWLGGACGLRDRLANIAPQASATASDRNEAAGRLINQNNDRTWNAWDNGPQGAAQAVSPEHPAWILLTWPRPVRLRGLNALWAGFGAADVQVYTGPAERHPREAAESDWQTVQSFAGIENQYPRALGVNWMDLGGVVTTRAVRLRLTRVTKESHPHLAGRTCQGKRVWLGELLALEPLGDSDLQAAVLPPAAPAPHPPLPVRFTLKEPGWVTLVLEDGSGRRVRNLISETFFPAGDNVAWWDGSDDLRRDPEAARHGLYHIPAQFVPPGTYRVRGLCRPAIDLRYEFSVYNAGNPPWPTADHTGGWLANHTPPSSALFVPAARAPGGQPQVLLGSYVTEGGDGLAWVDLDGHKRGGEGWVGGAWTGAPFLARDDGDHPAPDVFAYAGSAWEGELRLTALTKAGDRPVLKYPLEGGKEASVLAGLAVRDGLLVCSLPRQKELLFVDSRSGKVTASAPFEDPRGLAFDAQGRLLVLGKDRLYQLPLDGGRPARAAPRVVVAEGLEDPQQLALDGRGNLYISDRGHSHQVKVFTPEGKRLRAIGHPGAPKAGPYDPGHLNNPNGLTIDSNNHLWVSETDFQPKRVSVWTLEGELVRAFYGPAEYGGGGTLDPKDRTRFYYHGMEFQLDWDRGTDRLVRVFYRPGPGDLKLPERSGLPETPLYVEGRRYFTNCWNSSPTNGAPIAFVFLDRDGIAVPVAALGRANDWDLLKEATFKTRWPAGADPKGASGSNQALFLWTDRNGDGRVQPEEVVLQKKAVGGITVLPDLSLVAARVDGVALHWLPHRFTPEGVPVYDLEAAETLAAGAQPPTSSGGDQALSGPDGWTVLTVAPKPFAPQSVGGVYRGSPRWSYPSLWPGLHASHESPPPDRPGELIGTTRLLGGFVTPRGDAGPLWAINGNMGDISLFTADGLFVATLFKDVRQGQSWAMPTAQRGLHLNDLTLHDENFWPSLTQTSDGRVYLVDGARTSLVRVDGLDGIRRLPEGTVKVSADDLEKARAFLVEAEARRQQSQGRTTLVVALRKTAPVVDGKLDDWAGAAWVDIDKRGVAANFNSNSQPYDVRAAVAVAGDRLFAAFRTGDPHLLRNSAEMPTALFRTGGALDLMIGTNPDADPGRQQPVLGDVRLLVTQVKGQTRALLYRAVVPGTKEPVPFSSPWRTITLDRVEDVSSQVQLAGADGNYELSVPLAVLGLHPREGETLQGDVGLLRGDGFQTLQRVYWSNKATGLTSDVPSEALLTPGLWGKWQFQAAP